MGLKLNQVDRYTFSHGRILSSTPAALPTARGYLPKERRCLAGGSPFFEANPVSAQQRFTSIAGRIVYNANHQNALKPGRVITIANTRYGSGGAMPRCKSTGYSLSRLYSCLASLLTLLIFALPPTHVVRGPVTQSVSRSSMNNENSVHVCARTRVRAERLVNSKNIKGKRAGKEKWEGKENDELCTDRSTCIRVILLSW